MTPPRSVAWVLIAASAAAVLLTGLVATFTLVRDPSAIAPDLSLGFWLRVAAACALTLASLALRAWRWIFLLRRHNTRIPIRDAYIGYLSGFSLLFAPLLVGEIFVRAYVHRRRANVPPQTTIVVNIWERLFDLAALLMIALAASRTGAVAAAALLLLPLRSTVLLTTSLVAWILPGLGLWLIANGVGRLDLVYAQLAYSASSLTVAPAGVLFTGHELLAYLERGGWTMSEAIAVVVAIRFATVGISTTLGVLMLLVHTFSSRRVAAHFDDIAHAYDVQIPSERRDALLVRKTGLMKEVLESQDGGRKGLDVGCGQGWYVKRMRELRFDVEGIDTSTGQLRAAATHLGQADLVRPGSALAIPAPDASYDFVYTINVLHHLSSIDEQRRAFVELARVLRPGGVIFVHEINTRNPIFRFYMGYVFPTLNCIDEGVERWLLPHRLREYTDLQVKDVRYFTFLPDFLPQAVVRWLFPLEQLLERSRFHVYSAHYMAVLQKPA